MLHHVRTDALTRMCSGTSTIKRFVYTSSFAAIGHPADAGYEFTEKDWATDNRGDSWDWAFENLEKEQPGEPW